MRIVLFVILALVSVFAGIFVFTVKAPVLAGTIVMNYKDGVMLSGGINYGTAEKLDRMLEQGDTLYVSSGGGFGQEGFKIAEVIEAKQISVFVIDECASACAIAIAPSKDIGGTGKIGIHKGAGIPVVKQIADYFVFMHFHKYQHDWSEIFANTDETMVWIDAQQDCKFSHVHAAWHDYVNPCHSH